MLWYRPWQKTLPPNRMVGSLMFWMEWPLLGGPVWYQLPHGGVATCPTGIATFLADQALPFLVHKTGLFVSCWNWNLNWVCCNLSGPYHSWYKTGLFVSCWNWNLNWVCCNLSGLYHSWYKTGLFVSCWNWNLNWVCCNLSWLCLDHVFF